MVNEVWVPIPGQPDWYQVSNTGRIRSFRTRQGHPASVARELKQPVIKGYATVNLGRDNKQRVHQLVLLAFVGPRPFLDAQVRHLDNNPLNNSLWNLAYGTASENYADRWRNGTNNDGVKNGRAKLTEEHVRFIRLGGAPSKELAARFGVSLATITAARAKRTWRDLA